MKRSALRRAFLTVWMVVQAPVAGRRKRLLLSLTLVTLLLAFSAQAQTGDWRDVERLEPGSPLAVKTQGQRRIPCSIEGATDTQLFCEVHVRRSLRTTTLVLQRSEVEEVRLLPHPNQAKDAEIGAAIGAVAGATSAATGHDTAQGAYAVFGGIAGAGFGALAGSLVAVFQLFHHSKLIYKR